MARTNVGRYAPKYGYAHAHWGRTSCSYCSGCWYPEAREARLNERAAESMSDYIESLE